MANQTVPMFRKLWLQLHWLLGIVCGGIVSLVALTSGIMSIEDELWLALNPGMRVSIEAGSPTLSAGQLAEIVRTRMPDRSIQSVAISHQRSVPALVILTPVESDRVLTDPARGDALALNPATGAILGTPTGDNFFQLVAQVNRFLLAEGTGKLLVVISILSLILLSLSGFYFRWPRHI